MMDCGCGFSIFRVKVVGRKPAHGHITFIDTGITPIPTGVLACQLQRLVAFHLAVSDLPSFNLTSTQDIAVDNLISRVTGMDSNPV
jgi:hypothetical protein